MVKNPKFRQLSLEARYTSAWEGRERECVCVVVDVGINRKGTHRRATTTTSPYFIFRHSSYKSLSFFFPPSFFPAPFNLPGFYPFWIHHDLTVRVTSIWRHTRLADRCYTHATLADLRRRLRCSHSHGSCAAEQRKRPSKIETILSSEVMFVCHTH